MWTSLVPRYLLRWGLGWWWQTSSGSSCVLLGALWGHTQCLVLPPRCVILPIWNFRILLHMAFSNSFPFSSLSSYFPFFLLPPFLIPSFHPSPSSLPLLFLHPSSYYFSLLSFPSPISSYIFSCFLWITYHFQGQKQKSNQTTPTACTPLPWLRRTSWVYLSHFCFLPSYNKMSYYYK